MKRLALSLFALSALLFSVAFATECTCCGTNGSSCCNPDAIADSIVSNCQNACSSNCVRLTPETCLQVKADLGDYLDSITNRVDEIYNIAHGVDVYAVQCIAYVNDIRDELQSAKTLLLQGNDASSYVTQAISSLENLTNRWSAIEGSSSDALIVSNVVTHITTRIKSHYKVVNYVRTIFPLLQLALDSLQRREENEIPTAIQSIEQSITYLDRIHNTSETGDLDILRENIASLEYQTSLLKSDATSIGGVLASFDCSPCGNGSSSSSGGDGGTADLTPILSAIQELRERMEFWLERLYNLLKKYYEDYNAAVDPVEGKPSMEDYSELGSNWFKRVEYLLYTVAYPNLDSDDGEEVPDKPYGYDDIERHTDYVKRDIDTDQQEIHTSVLTSVGRFQNAFNRLAGYLTNWAPSDSGNLAGPILEYKQNDRTFWALDVPDDMLSGSRPAGAFLEFFRKAMRILWSMLTLSLYCYALFLYVRLICGVVKFMYTSVIDSLS